MPSWVAALLFAIGGGAWLYNKLMRTTGGNTQSAIIVTIMASIFMFAFFWMFIDFIAGIAN